MSRKVREYTPPVFHIERAGEEQKKTAEAIFQTMQKSKVTFAVCRQDPADKDSIKVHFYGDFDLAEEINILTEITQIYQDEPNVKVGVGRLIW